jgi:hypothetical protein
MTHLSGWESKRLSLVRSDIQHDANHELTLSGQGFRAPMYTPHSPPRSTHTCVHPRSSHGGPDSCPQMHFWGDQGDGPSLMKMRAMIGEMPFSTTGRSQRVYTAASARTHTISLSNAI